MNELRPLLEETDDSRLRALLEAGRADVPPGQFEGRLLLGLGLGVVAIGGVSSAAAASVESSALAPAAAAAKLAPSAMSLVAKWVVVGVCSGGLLAGSVELITSWRAPPEAALRAVASAPASTPRVPFAPPPASAAAVAQVEPLPGLAPAPAVPVGEARRSASTPARSDGVASEVQLIDAARRALAQGQLRQALSQLDAYDRSAPSGVLLREARVLRIEALHRAGETARARSQAQRYLREFPQDAHAPRLRSLTFPPEAR